MTCQGMAFPYVVFYCHAVTPTTVYDVTLRRREEDGAAATMTMQALAVCHQDTSGFNPEIQFFVERRLRPGNGATACHFVSRDSVVWTLSSST
ncbi:hypothetical protein ACP70R_022811 [Stipagrostis hirtigluma subsp. patula]